TQELTLLTKDPPPLDETCRHFCMAKPTQYDVMLGERKIAGAAQRRRKQGYLHQGSIAIALPEESFLQALLLPDTQVYAAMHAQSYSILGKNWSKKELEEVRMTLKQQLEKELTR